MRTFCTWALVLAVPALWATAARADVEISPGSTTAQLLLLRQKSVQEDLKLTPEVVTKVADFTAKEAAAYGKALKLGEKEREKAIEGLEKANRKFLADNLTAEQRKRLGQITMQVTGLRQLNRPEVAKALDLTAEQQKKFKDMETEARKQFEAIISDPNRAGKNEKLAKLRQDINTKIEAVLTDQQKAKAREHVGEPFKGELLFEEEPGK